MTEHTYRYLKSFFNRNCKSNWDSFDSFLEEVGTPVKPRVRLTRKCITRGFVPGNLVWARNINNSSAYLVRTSKGSVASMRHACEQDGVKYNNPILFMRRFDMHDNPQAVFNYSKLDKNTRKAFRRNALADAVRSLA